MSLQTLSHQVTLSLLIGAETFAVAALWPLSEWAANAWRHRAFLLALAVTAACIALDTHAFAFARMVNDPGRWAAVDNALAWLVVPLFLALPGAVCVASAQSLRHAGLSARPARAVSLLAAAFAVVVAPAAGYVAGCSLAGMCI
jgi:hypothetical protein